MSGFCKLGHMYNIFEGEKIYGYISDSQNMRENFCNFNAMLHLSNFIFINTMLEIFAVFI